MKRYGLALIVALLARSGGAHAEEPPTWQDSHTILVKASEWELFPLDPFKEKLDPQDAFRGWKVLGKTVIKEANTRKALMTALDQGIAKEKARLRIQQSKEILSETGCFQPRHGIRATVSGTTVEVLICFECRPIQFYVGEQKGKE